jgi:hypothetical protein
MTTKHLALTLAITFLALYVSAQAQTARLSTINVTSDGERVHIAAEGDVYEIRIDVADEQGAVVFQSGAITGQQLDWKMRDTQGERVQSGTYLVTVTFRNAAGKLHKRVEQVTVDEAEKSGTPIPAAPAATPTPLPVKTTGTVTVGRIPKFFSIGTNAATITNSIITEKSGKIGIGTSNPTRPLEIASGKLRLSNNLGDIEFTEVADLIAHATMSSPVPTDPAFRVDTGTQLTRTFTVLNNGNVGIQNPNPLRALQIGPSFDAAFTLSPSDASARAGYIRFGDHTGWTLHFARSRESSGGPLNNGITGNLMELRDDGRLRLVGFPEGATGTGPLCRTLSNVVTICESGSSSLRYKTNVAPYLKGLNIVDRLRPITFTRKESGRRGVGLAAEEVKEVEPLLAFDNERGEAEGVRYELVAVTLINAVKEQQAQIKQQGQQIEQLQSEVRQLKRMVKQRRKRRR